MSGYLMLILAVRTSSPSDSSSDLLSISPGSGVMLHYSLHEPRPVPVGILGRIAERVRGFAGVASPGIGTAANTAWDKDVFLRQD